MFFFISHVTPDDGTGKNAARSIYTTMKDIPLVQKLKIMGSDDTTVVIVKNNSYIASLEALIRGPLQWVISLVHLNKLPIPQVFQALDRITTGPDSFSESLGKKLNGDACEWTVVKFKFIPNAKFPVLPNSVVDDLGSDLYCAYNLLCLHVGISWC